MNTLMKRGLAILLVLYPVFSIAQSFDTGWNALQHKNFDEAEKIFRQLDKKGDPQGMFGLGVMTEFGYGTVKKDPVTARHLYEQAAKLGLPAANHNIGNMYQHGLGVEISLPTAVEYYTKAANAGYAISQNYLAYMYYSGMGVKQNYKTALRLLQASRRRRST